MIRLRKFGEDSLEKRQADGGGNEKDNTNKNTISFTKRSTSERGVGAVYGAGCEEKEKKDG